MLKAKVNLNGDNARSQYFPYIKADFVCFFNNVIFCGTM